MGAWNYKIFGNDTACDWAFDLEECVDLSFIDSTIRKLIDNNDYIEAPDAEEALAAIDTITRLRGHFSQKDSYTESIDQWVLKFRLDIPKELIEISKTVISKVLSDKSELYELWSESADFSEWNKEILDLLTRLDKEAIDLPELLKPQKSWWQFWK